MHGHNVAESQRPPVGRVCCLPSSSLCPTHLAHDIYLLFSVSCWAPVDIWILDPCLLAIICGSSTSLITNDKRGNRISETREACAWLGNSCFFFVCQVVYHLSPDSVLWAPQITTFFSINKRDAFIFLHTFWLGDDRNWELGVSESQIGVTG